MNKKKQHSIKQAIKKRFLETISTNIIDKSVDEGIQALKDVVEDQYEELRKLYNVSVFYRGFQKVDSNTLLLIVTATDINGDDEQKLSITIDYDELLLDKPSPADIASERPTDIEKAIQASQGPKLVYKDQTKLAHTMANDLRGILLNAFEFIDEGNKEQLEDIKKEITAYLSVKSDNEKVYLLIDASYDEELSHTLVVNVSETYLNKNEMDIIKIAVDISEPAIKPPKEYKPTGYIDYEPIKHQYTSILAEDMNASNIDLYNEAAYYVKTRTVCYLASTSNTPDDIVQQACEDLTNCNTGFTAYRVPQCQKHDSYLCKLIIVHQQSLKYGVYDLTLNLHQKQSYLTNITCLNEQFEPLQILDCDDNKPVKLPPDSIAKLIHDNLVGWFKFNEQDGNELKAIIAKTKAIVATLNDSSTTYDVNKVYYDMFDGKRVLVVKLHRYCINEQPEPLKLWIDYHDTDCIDKPKPEAPDPYSEEALRSLTVKQFLALLDTITIIKEDFE